MAIRNGISCCLEEEEEEEEKDGGGGGKNESVVFLLSDAGWRSFLELHFQGENQNCSSVVWAAATKHGIVGKWRSPALSAAHTHTHLHQG